MSWYYENQLIEELPETCVGFVYLITNNITGRKYIGKKLAKFSKTSYKTVKLKNGNKKKKKIRSKIDSDCCTVVSLTGPRSDMPTEPVYCTRKYYIKAKRWEKNPRLLCKTAFV